MTKKSGVTLCRTGQSLCLVFLCATMGGFIFSGCSKEKSVESKASVSCEVFDRLPEDMVKSVEVNFGNKIKLLGITIRKQSPNQLKMSYYWQRKDGLGQYKQVFVHFTDDHRILFQDDHEFCRNQSFEGIKGQFIRETSVVDIPPSSAGKKVYVKVGIYSSESGGRLKIEPQGNVRADDENTRALVDTLDL